MPNRTLVPERLLLTARDAFNGLLLWKRPLSSRPPFIRRGISPIVATKDRLFVVLEDRGPLLALDAATGKELKRYDCHALFRYSDGKLIFREGQEVRVMSAETGKLLWKHPVLRGSLPVIADGGVFYIEGSKGRRDVVCRDLSTGKEKWRSSSGAWLPEWVKTNRGRQVWYGGKMDGKLHLSFVYRGALALHGGGGIHVLSAKDGKHRWSHAYIPVSYYYTG